MEYGLVYECKVPAGNVADAAVNCEKLDVGISSKRRFLTYTYQLVAYKYVPYCVKRFFWFYPDIINETKDILDDNIEPYVWLESIFYKNMNLNVSKDQNNTFRLYHLKGLHGPRYTDSNLNEVDERVSWDEAYEGNMLLLSSFLSELKKKNIYDNSVIVILADHGESYDSDGGEIKDNPLFMLKGKNENHEFAISDIAVSYAELQKIYLGLIKGEKSYEAVEELYKENKRIFLRYDYDVEKKEDDYFPAIRECLINGNAADVDAVEYTGKVYTNR